MEKVQMNEIVKAVGSATREVFTTMLGLPIEEGTAQIQPIIQPESFHGVVALVGIAGSYTGTGHISCSPQFAEKVAGALLMSQFDAVSEDVLDAVAEVANMIIGNVKTTFEEKLGSLGLSVPTVIYGRNYRTRSAGVQDWVLMPFKCGEETMDIHFCLFPTPVRNSTLHAKPVELQTA